MWRPIASRTEHAIVVDHLILSDFAITIWMNFSDHHCTDIYAIKTFIVYFSVSETNLWSVDYEESERKKQPMKKQQKRKRRKNTRWDFSANEQNRWIHNSHRIIIIIIVLTWDWASFNGFLWAPNDVYDTVFFLFAFLSWTIRHLRPCQMS